MNLHDMLTYIWVVVKIMVPFRVPSIIRHLLFRVSQKWTLILTTTHISATFRVRFKGSSAVLIYVLPLLRYSMASGH